MKPSHAANLALVLAVVGWLLSFYGALSQLAASIFTVIVIFDQAKKIPTVLRAGIQISKGGFREEGINAMTELYAVPHSRIC